jgi:hypothetical protein
VEKALRIQRLLGRYAEITQHRGRSFDGDLPAFASRNRTVLPGTESIA